MVIPPAPLVMDRARGPVSCHLRFAHDMVSEFPSLLPRGVTVAQVTLDHFVMVRIHARQVVLNQGLKWFTENRAYRYLSHFLAIFSKFTNKVPAGSGRKYMTSDHRVAGSSPAGCIPQQ
jgi:hypothetical protein